MALCAVNLAECAEEKIPPSTMAEIHLTAAVGLKTRCGGKLGFLAVSHSVLYHCSSMQSSGKGCKLGSSGVCSYGAWWSDFPWVPLLSSELLPKPGAEPVQLGAQRHP